MCAPPLSDTNTLQVSSIPLKELKKIAYYRIYMNSYLTQQIFQVLRKQKESQEIKLL
jgi:hypothetical protein